MLVDLDDHIASGHALFNRFATGFDLGDDHALDIVGDVIGRAVLGGDVAHGQANRVDPQTFVIRRGFAGWGIIEQAVLFGFFQFGDGDLGFFLFTCTPIGHIRGFTDFRFGDNAW